MFFGLLAIMSKEYISTYYYYLFKSKTKYRTQLAKAAVSVSEVKKLYPSIPSWNPIAQI